MPLTIEDREVTELFDRFSEEFATFDGRAVARLFAAPGVALRRDSMLVGFSSTEVVQRYYQEALDRYRALGCTRAVWRDLSIVPVSDTAAMASVSWDLFDKSNAVLSQWRQAYHLARFPTGMLIYGSAFVSAP